MAPPIRVLVVDDSAFVRKVIREVLSTSPRIQVVDTAKDGLEALERVAELKPDVMTLDLVMPHLDGIGVLQALPTVDPPRVVVVSTSDADSELGLEALHLGAVDLVHKPTALATARLYELSGELIHKVEMAAVAKPAPPTTANGPHAKVTAAAASGRDRILVVGTSTGGPQALTRLVSALPGDFPMPVAMVVHIPPGYTQALARRLDLLTPLEVVEAWDGIELRPGRVTVARGGMHLRIERGTPHATGHLDLAPLASAHRPSVDVLFESAAASYGAGVLGVVLTGMGDDGLEGARRIRAAGGKILTEAESSCVIYGMPRTVHEAGLANAEAPLDAMVAEILRWI